MTVSEKIKKTVILSLFIFDISLYTHTSIDEERYILLSLLFIFNPYQCEILKNCHFALYFQINPLFYSYYVDLHFQTSITTHTKTDLTISEVVRPYYRDN